LSSCVEVSCLIKKPGVPAYITDKLLLTFAACMDKQFPANKNCGNVGPATQYIMNKKLLVMNTGQKYFQVFF